MSNLRLTTTPGRPPHLTLSQRDPAFYGDPYAAYRQMHAAAPVFFWNDIGRWCFAGYEQVNAILRDRRFGRQILHVMRREELGRPPPAAHLADFDAVEAHSLLELEPPAHTRLRALVNRAFVSRNVERLAPRIAGLAHRLIDGFADARRVELIEAFASVVPVTVIAEMLGVPAEDGPRLLDWSHKMVRMYLFGRSHDDELAANRAAAEFAAYLRSKIAEKRARPTDDLLTLLVAAEKDGETLSEAEIVSTAILLLNAGHEATVHQIGNAVLTILVHRLDTQRLFADPRRVALCVEECLRFAPPLHLFMRYALADLEIDGLSFKAGDEVGLLLAAANRDPTRFAAPDRFLPERDEGPHLSFGAGLHFCIGAPLARIELQVALPVLFDRLPGLALADKPRLADSYHFHGLERLDLVW